jgi:hypothetical protein
MPENKHALPAEELKGDPAEAWARILGKEQRRISNNDAYAAEGQLQHALTPQQQLASLQPAQLAQQQLAQQQMVQLQLAQQLAQQQLAQQQMVQLHQQLAQQQLAQLAQQQLAQQLIAQPPPLGVSPGLPVAPLPGIQPLAPLLGTQPLQSDASGVNLGSISLGATTPSLIAPVPSAWPLQGLQVPSPLGLPPVAVPGASIAPNAGVLPAVTPVAMQAVTPVVLPALDTTSPANVQSAPALMQPSDASAPQAPVMPVATPPASSAIIVAGVNPEGSVSSTSAELSIGDSTAAAASLASVVKPVAAGTGEGIRSSPY